MRSVFWTLCGVASTSAYLAACAAPAVSPAAPPEGPEPEARAAEFFEAKVRPLLTARCAVCHSRTNAKGGLDLSTRAALLKGGAHGPAAVPGNPDRSLLVQAVRYSGKLRMPLGGKLADGDVQILEEWVRNGASWGVDAPHSASPGKAGADHWAFQPVREPRVPAVKNAGWARTEIDRFILARLEREGLKPNPAANPRTLIRRVTFDLTGLPPTQEEIDAFLADKSPDAWEKVVDRLLASPAYGERWGRRWLDVVRYADSNGLDWNEVFPNAWRYRDYVIRSFNADKPFDRFIQEQLAGDLLPARTPEEKYEQLTATGVLVMGPKLLAQQDREQLAMDVVDEQIDLTSKAFLGLTVSCARCHDHKFDPIPTKDYYALAGIFKSTETLHGTLPRNDRVMYWMERPLAAPDVVAARTAHDQAVKKLEAALKKAKDAAEKERLNAEIKALQVKAPPAVPTTMAVQDTKIEDVRVHIRGSHENLGEVAPRGFLTVVAGEKRPIPAGESGRRELAEWIASPQNPLTARVLVNRIWQGHFGVGLVRTPDNFGLLGERPSDPELLDFLASCFTASPMDGETERKRDGEKSGVSAAKPSLLPALSPSLRLGWSIKKLHRLILLSAAYQMSSAPNPSSAARDPENRLLWRMNRHRLEAEAIRDAVLQATGNLDRTPGGTLLTKTSGLAGKEWSVDYSSPRRSVYLPVVRGVIYDMFQVFDFADPHVVNGRRDTTTVAPQALFMMNSPFIADESTKFADSLLALSGDDRSRVEAAYERALCRPASAGEVDRALSFIRDYAGALDAKTGDEKALTRAAWGSFCQALFASSEFRYID